MTAIVPFQRPATQALTLSDMQDVAKAFAASGYFKDATDVAKAYTKVLAGSELGIPPMQAMTGIHIVEGKPTLSAALVGALIKRSGRYDYRVATLTDTECVLMFFQDGEELGESRFTMDDARKIGVAGKQVWQKYARNMLLSRALTNGARWFCPDVFGGAVYTPEEMGANVDEDGDVIDSASPAAGASTPAGSQPSAPQEPVVPAAPPADGPGEAEDSGPVDVEALEIASVEEIDAFYGLVDKVAALDPKGKDAAWWRLLADKAAEKEHGRKVGHLTSDELAGLARQFQEHYATLAGAASPEKGADTSPSGAPVPADTTSAGEEPSGDGTSAQEEAADAPAEQSLFQPPTGPRGSKRKEAA
jgi:hypothetical protein